MATIIPIIKNGKVQSFKIRTYLGRDELGKQIVKYTHWYIPEGVSESKAKKMVKKEAKAWEKEQQSGITREKREKKICTGGGTMPLSVFIKEKWLPLCVYDGNHKPATVKMYEQYVAHVIERFGERDIRSIQSIEIQEFLIYLTTKKRNYRGKMLTPSSSDTYTPLVSIDHKFAPVPKLSSFLPYRMDNADRRQKGCPLSL